MGDAGSDDDFEYEEVQVESDDEGGQADDLELALRTVKQLASRADAPAGTASTVRSSTPAPGEAARRPEMMDDFVRNFLHKTGMERTLEVFETEWYEISATRGAQIAESGLPVPELYSRITELEDTVRGLQAELESASVLTTKAATTWEVLRKERDTHRMHHKRISQEKNHLINELKRLRTHYAQYEPTIKELRQKYESVSKEKMLVRLERDRLSARVVELDRATAELSLTATKGAEAPPAQPAAAAPPPAARAGDATGTLKRTAVKGASLPSGPMINPFAQESFEPATVTTFRQQKTFKGHALSVSNLAMHPKKPVLATASDDRTWKLWSLPSGELIMSGEGHTDWVAGIDFHPAGTHLASSSGDATVKIWDFEKRKCVLTMSEHAQAVWSVAYHSAGDFLASGSLDHSARMWDAATGRCRATFRGHVDSVNEVCWQPYTNVLATCSSDKTVSLWDARTGLCAQTFYGHMNSCNHVLFNRKATVLASCDADGCVKLWDARMGAETLTINVGPHPANRLAFDCSGEILAVASDDGRAKCVSALTGEELTELEGHEDAVQAVLFDPNGKFIVTGSSDKTFRLWAA